MDWFIALYGAQPFWLWLGIGVMLLAIESMFSTEWLLWPAVAAGVTALAAALFPMGLAGEIGLFAGLTVVMTLASRRLVRKVNPIEAPDINDVRLRLVGQRARVVEAFVGGQGRVYVSGAEWPAEIEGDAPAVGESVTIDSVAGPRLKVRAV